MRLRLFARLGRLSRLHITTMLAVAALIVVGSGLVSPTRAAKPGVPLAAYVVTDLGSPRYRNWSTYWSRAYEINEPDNQGLPASQRVMDIIGWDDRGSAVWAATANGVVVSRENEGTNLKVTSVNNHGLIVGTIGASLFADVPSVGIVALPNSAGYSPAAVNNLGHVVAQQQVLGDPSRGIGAMWIVAADGTVSGPMDLGSFRPLDINDWDEMAGLQDSTAAIAWFEAGELQVSKLPGLSPGNLGVATALNNRGDVVGYSTDLLIDTGTYRPFLWTPEQGLRSLGSLGGVHGKALGINDQRQIVGWSYTLSNPFNEQHAFLWQNDAMFDLNGKIAADSNRTLQSADGINNFGHIVGSMYTVARKTTTLKTFLLTPTP